MHGSRSWPLAAIKRKRGQSVTVSTEQSGFAASLFYEKSWFSGFRDYLGPYWSVRKDFFIAPFFLPFLAILWLKNAIFPQTRNVMSNNQVLQVQCKLIIDNQMHLTHFQLFLWLKNHFWPQNRVKNGKFSQTRNVMSNNQVLLVQCKLITDNQMHFTHFQLFFAKEIIFGHKIWPFSD